MEYEHAMHCLCVFHIRDEIGEYLLKAILDLTKPQLLELY